MESLSLLRYLVIRDKELRSPVSQPNSTLSLLFCQPAWLMLKADDVPLLPSDRCVGKAVQDQRRIPQNAASVYRHIKRLLFR